MDLFKAIANLLLFINILNSEQEIPMKEKTTYHSTYAHQAIDILKAEVKREHGIRCCGRGGSMPSDIRTIGVDFETRKVATIDESRELLVNIVEKFQRIINEHHDIQPFLREHPFPVNRIKIAVSFRENLDDGMDNIQVGYVFAVKGMVYYSKRDKNTFKHIDLYEEPYEDALKIVRGSQP